MRPFLVLVLISAIIFMGVKLFYNPPAANQPIVMAPVTPPAPSTGTFSGDSQIPIPKLPPLLNDEELKKILDSTQDYVPTVRWQALKFLITSKAPQAAEITYKMLQQDMDINVRKNIVLLLPDHPELKPSVYLLKALKDTSPAVRIAALQMLEKLGDYSTAPTIGELLRDSDDAVRLQAITTINALQAKREAEIKRQEEERRREEEMRKHPTK